MPSAPQQNHWALVVGIDRYPLFGSEGQLDGCVADAREMASVLRDRFGFAASRTTLLLDEQATRGAILAALYDLAGRVGEDDAVVFHYSGHGSQRASPAENPSEPDNMEETLVPYDSGRKDPFPNRDIAGGEIHEWLLRVTRVTPYVTLILDCCHSGTAVPGRSTSTWPGWRRRGTWVRVDDGEELFEGASLSFSVTNRGSIPLFVYVLDCGLTGNVGLVYPVQGSSDPLSPGRSIEIGTRPGEEIDLYVPDEVNDGEEVLKLFATTREADLSPLFQPAASAARDARPYLGYDGMPPEDWTAIERRFLLKRRPWG